MHVSMRRILFNILHNFLIQIKMNMKKIKDIAIYFFVIMLSNCAATFLARNYVYDIFASIFPHISTLPQFLVVILFIIIVYPITLLLVWFCVLLWFGKSVPRKYSEDTSWFQSAAKMILPSEFIRYYICVCSRVFLNSTDQFACIPTDLYDMVWLRLTEGRQGNFIDFIGYSVCYSLYLVLYLSVIFMLYKKFWNVGKQEKEDMITYDSPIKRNF